MLAPAAELSIETLKLPAGFKLEIFATEVENARQLALGDKATVFAGSRSAGNVYALVDDNADYRADRQLLIASDLNMPSGIARPMVDLGAHVAPLGMAFYAGKQFPEKYRGGFFVAEHGSWNRSEKTGYRVIFVKPGKGAAKPVVEPFITGWLDREEDSAWGRPVDILNLPDGSILISDDFADAIYRVSYVK